MRMDEPLRSRLANLGVDPDSYGDPFDIWCRLRVEYGARATLIDLYTLAAHSRGQAAHELSQIEREGLAAQALPIAFPGYQVIPGSGRQVRDPIEITPYDEDWPLRYEMWRSRLSNALGPTAERIDHVGSTAVPGLAAKPVIDIQVSVQRIGDEDAYVANIEALGIQLRSRDDEHRFFRPFSGLPRDVQVHVCSIGSRWEWEHLLFRDYLRGSESAREAYTDTKRRAAARWRDDRLGYPDAKSDRILDLLVLAEEWARRVGWTAATG